jgi:3-hydroxyisobutyryl-CoA hydrolase
VSSHSHVYSHDNSLNCRAPTSELGLATHYIPSRRIQSVVDALTSLDRVSMGAIDSIIEDCSQEREPGDRPCIFTGEKRVALDSCFGHDKVEDIMTDLKNVETSHQNPEIRTWAQETLAALELRSPTSLKVALIALRKGREGTLQAALQRELNIATAYCVSPSVSL